MKEQNKSLFSLVNKRHQRQLKSVQIITKLDVSFEKFGIHTHKLFFCTHFIYFALHHLLDYPLEHIPKLYMLPLNFDAKFQLLYINQNQPNSPIIGIRFFGIQRQPLALYSLNQSSLLLFSTYLRKVIRQIRFERDFVMRDFLGQGTHGQVYKIVRVKDGKHYAGKIFSKYIVSKSNKKKLCLQNQVNILRQVSKRNKNLPQFYGIFENQTQFIILMEFIEGKTLRQLICEKKYQFSSTQIKSILRGILKGVETLHSISIIHRDLKPDNIIVRKTSEQFYEPVIIDFSIASKIHKYSEIYHLCGTPGYIAPEVIDSRYNKYPQMCDIFSVGCIFYQLMTKNNIFQGETHEEVFENNKSFSLKLKKDNINPQLNQAWDMLEAMVNYQPSLRISPSQALKNNFFAVESSLKKKIKDGIDSKRSEAVNIAPKICISIG